ncbi:helix-turn-helix domain-containing protein [Polaribacter tangerinus]|uniref:helix-turn-helix domain-containing protein n=1 Tax=Polaribacter tangerinus TaxID=1920034 RepID=UPI000B4AA1E9
MRENQRESERRICKIKNYIRESRLKKGYSQENLGEILGISQNSYQKLETGKTKLTLERFFEISICLDISIYQLLSTEEKENLSKKIMMKIINS